jgi:hypothetical protein
MDIKTVIRAAGQTDGLIKRAYTMQTFRAHGISPNPNLNAPQQPKMPAQTPAPVQKEPIAPKTINPVTAQVFNNRQETTGFGANVLQDKMQKQNIIDAAEAAKAKADRGELGRGRVYQDNNGVRVLNAGDSKGAAHSARQFAGVLPEKFRWWKPWTWDRTAGSGVNAGTNANITVTDRNGGDTSALQRGVNNGTSINLRKAHSDWRFWRRMTGDPVHEVDARYIYTPKAYGTHISNKETLPVWYDNNKATGKDEPQTNTPQAVTWQTDENGRSYRDINANDVDYDREMRARDLMDTLHGKDTFNDDAFATYNDVLGRMSDMRNNSTYYKNGTWTSDALNYWRGDKQFQDVFDQIGTSSRFDRDAVMNAFLANANNMYRTNAKFVPQQAVQAQPVQAQPGFVW